MLGNIENLMLIDSWWGESEYHVPAGSWEALREPGYVEEVTGIFVRDVDAFDYAVERMSLDEDLKQEFLEWFYSRNWIKEE